MKFSFLSSVSIEVIAATKLLALLLVIEKSVLLTARSMKQIYLWSIK